MLKFDKQYDGWENDFHSTKQFVCVCTKHHRLLEENEEYIFRFHVGHCSVEFDEDEVDLSGMMCPEGEECDNFWEALQITPEKNFA